MFRVLILILGLVLSSAAQANAAGACESVTLTGVLEAGSHFEQPIGGNLVFRLDPEGLGAEGKVAGWRISMVSPHEPDRDYIYPVNPPLRFNGLQILGPSYGDDTKVSLAQPHEMRFLLGPEDYDRFWPLVNNALWPYSAPHPDKSEDEYETALQKLSIGEVKFAVRKYDADPVSGSIRRMEFQAEITAPANFGFSPALKPAHARCPVAAD